jgi:hypothetical protein
MVQGVIGDTYERFTVGQEAFNPNSTYYLPEDVSLSHYTQNTSAVLTTSSRTQLRPFCLSS